MDHDRVDEADDNHGVAEIANKGAPLSNGARDDGRGRGRKGILEHPACVASALIVLLPVPHTRQRKVRAIRADERVARVSTVVGDGVANEEPYQAAEAGVADAL